MRTLRLVAHLSDAELIDQLKKSKAGPVERRWQVLYLVQVAGLRSAAVIAPLVKLSNSSIYKIIEAYNSSGTTSVAVKPRGGRKRFLLTLEQEAALLHLVEKRAEAGLIKTANDIRELVEQKVGRAVSDDFLWDLLHRNNWKKKKPRPHHPKRDKAGQASFKKNSPKTWTP